jgi:hypothetical protein
MTKTKYNRPYAKRIALLVRTKISDCTTLQRIKKNLKICRKKLGENRKFYNYSLPTEMEI